MCLECSGRHRQLGVHVSFCRSTGMDKWTYRQLYRCAVGGNARARAHWKKCGADPQEKIDTKYTSMVAHNYKMALEKDVADACRIGLDALMHESSSMSGAGATPAAPSDPFADYINSLQPKKATSLGAINVAAASPSAVQPLKAPASIQKTATTPTAVTNPSPVNGTQMHAASMPVPLVANGNATTPSLAAASSAAPGGLSFKPQPKKKAGLGGAVKRSERRPSTDDVPDVSDAADTMHGEGTAGTGAATPKPVSPKAEPLPADPAPTHPAARIAATTPFHSATAAAGAKPASTLKPLSSLGSLQKKQSTPAVPSGGVCGAWAELEASTKAPAKPKSTCSLGLGALPGSGSAGTSASFTSGVVKGSGASINSSSTAPPRPAAAAAAVNATKTPDDTPVATLVGVDAPSTLTPAAPVAPLFASSAAKPRGSLISSSKPNAAKKLGGVARKTGSGASDAAAFGDFGFNEDDESKNDSDSSKPSNNTSGDSEWGWDGMSPKKPEATPAPVEDDPWADPLKPVGSSMFSYECASLHAQPSAQSQPASTNKPKPLRSLASDFESEPPPLEAPPQAAAGNGADPYGTLARDRFGSSVTGFGSDSFMMQEPKTAAAPAGRDPAEEEAERQRRLDKLLGSGAQGFGSSDLDGDSNSPGRAARLAESTKAISGAAIGLAASLLSRATSKTG